MTQQVFVRKSEKMEKFNNDKIINSLLSVGLPASLAVSTANEIFEEIKNNETGTEIEISSKEIRAKVYTKLKDIDNKLADKYIQGNTIKVRTSLSTFEDFDASKITSSLIEETGIDEENAKKISKAVKKQMGKLNLEFVTAPLIREMVCVELLKGGFEKERKLYTRLGMPVYDVSFLIEHGSKENANLQFNPETIHKLMADQISKEYSLIKTLPLELADAHMRGEIHIHDMDYFCLDKNEKIWTVNPTPKFTTIGEWIDNNINDNDANNNAHFKIFSGANGIAKPTYVSELFKRKNDENLCKIFLDNGDDIKVTNQHRFFSLGLKNKEFLIYPFIDKLSNLHLNDGFYNQERSKFKVPGKIKASKFLDIILNQILCGRNDDKEKRIIFRIEFGDIVENALKNLGIPFTKKYISKENRTKNIVINSKIWYEILMNLCNYMETKEITADNLEKGMLVEVPREIVIDEKDEIKEINILEHIIKNKSKILAEDEFLIKNIGVKYTDGTIKPLEDIDKINGQETELIITYNYNPKINYSIPVFLKIDDELVTVIAGVVTEGWLSKTHLKNRNPVYGVSFSNKDKNIIKKFNLAAESIFGKHPKNYLRENGVTTVTFGSKIAYLLFKYVFSIGEYAKNKKLPDFTIMLNEDNIKSLLDFFKKCDGNGMDEYCTSSEDLAGQIKWLLRRLGKGCLTHKQQNMFIIKESENKYISFQETNFVCVKEKKISDKPGYVYDLSCPDARRYLIGASPVYVHNSTRPFCFSHDIRFFLKHGLKVDGVGNHTAVAGPAKKPEVAFLHAAKVLASAQVNCAGGQGFSYFNTFLAPYIRGLPYEKVKQLAQMFIYEMSMMYVARGGQTVFSSIDCDMEVPEQFKNIPAVLPGGIVKENTTYADFEDETKTLFNAIVDVYLEGDYTGKAFNFPKFEVQLYPKKIDKNEDMLLKVSELAAKFGTPYYIINQPYMPLYACYQCCAFLMPLSDANTEDDVRDGTVRGGALQVVTINLPQIAYESNRDENKFFEILKERMNKAKKVHLLKREIIKKNQNLEMLPFMSQIVNEKGDKYLEVDRQSFVIGLVGMNECVKFMTGYELHEDTGWKFGLKVMNKMKNIVADIRKETGLNFSLARTPAESSAYRLAQIDIKKYPNQAITNGEGKDAYYTNSFHTRPSADIPLWKRLSVEGSFHPLTDGGAMSHVWLGEQNPNPEAILSLTKKIATKTAIQYMAFTKDLTVCSNCNFVTGGLLDRCPNCGSENVEWWSRITGYYQNIKGWNKGKLKELQDRRRYGVEDENINTGKEISFTMKEGVYESRFEKLKEKLKYDTSLDF